MRVYILGAVVMVVGLALASPGRAQRSATRGEQTQQLNNLVAQLQAHPSDRDLRRQIIRLANSMNPRPKIPEQVQELYGAAVQAMKEATKPSDYASAVEAFKKASLLAPWVPNIYYNLGDAQEKAGQYADAAASLKLYLFAAPDASDRQAVAQRIGALQYSADTAAKKAATKAARVEALREELSADIQCVKEDGSPDDGKCLNLPNWGGPNNTHHIPPLGGGVLWFAWGCSTGQGPSPGNFTQVSEMSGCNSSEAHGDSWRQHPVAGEAPRTQRRAEVEVYRNIHICVGEQGGCPSQTDRKGKAYWGAYEGILEGPTVEDIRWCQPSPDGSQCTPVWGEIAANGKSFFFSEDRPLDPASFDPSVRYRYVEYVAFPYGSWGKH